MPTEPYQSFIPNETFENPKLVKILNQFSDKIKETVNFGSHVFNWSWSTATGGVENIPIFLLFRHALELIDSISMLVKLCRIDPCKVILRAVFESILSIEYILKEDSKQRAIDFMVWYTHEKLKVHRRWDPEDQMYKEFRKKIEKDDILKDWKMNDFPYVQQVKEEIKRLKERLKNPHYIDSEKEYKRFKKKEGSPRWWFSLRGGPKSIDKLAEELNRAAQYYVLYREWSSAVHGTDIRGKYGADETGRVFIHQIRLPNDAQIVTHLAIGFALTIIRNFTNHSIPDKWPIVRKWYITEIRDFHLPLSKEELIKVK